MQNINAILKVGGTGTAWVTPFGAQVPLPVVTVGIKAALCLDLRGDDPAGSSDLPAYPIEQFAGASSWYFAIDNDYDRDTFPKLLQITGISVASVDGATILTAVVPNTAVPGLLEAVGKLKNVTLGAEIGWLDAEGDTIGCIGFDLTITNRRYLPGTIPEEVQNDPEYLTSAQVLAHINAAVADAVAALDVTGEPGPPPTITLGTVQSGDTAAATLAPVPDTPGAYTLSLTLPRGQEGAAASAPVLTMGTVQSGGTAAATLTPVPDTPGAYTLSLTLPRGIDGSGITPLTGNWNAETIYSLRDALRHNGAWWYSKSEGNVGHAPPDNRQSDAYWQLIVADGEDAEPVLMAFTPDPNEQSAWHLPPYTAGDTHYRFSLDGGATWGVTMPLSMPAASTVILFNEDAESDWAAPTAVVGQSYSTVFGKYMRARRAGGTYGEPLAVHDLDPQTLRIQFSAPPADGQEPSWHAALQTGDDRVRIFNAAGSIGPSVFTFTLDGLELDSVQFCAVEDPWHASYVDGDRYRKFSTDGGLTYGQPIPLYGASAYEEWLAAGNTGTEQDFLDSLKGADGTGEGGATTPLSNNSPFGLGLAAAGISAEAARADHVHPVTGLVLSSEKGVVMGVATLGLDGRVPATQLPEAAGGVSLPITRQRFARPYFDQAMHLVIQAAAELDFSDAETIIDTENNAADRAKVISYTGFVLTPCPEDGFGGAFSGQPVFVDLSALTEVTFLRYKWTAAEGDSDWYVTFFPSNGEAYVAPPAGISGETPAPTTFGTLKVDIAGALTGQWSADGGSTWHDSGDTITLAAGSYTVSFAYVSGYTTPSSQSVTISNNALIELDAAYYAIVEPTETEGTLIVNITGATGRWSVDAGANWKASGQSLLLTAGSYTITFEAILGYSKPDDIPVTVVAGNITVKSGAYVEQPDSADPTDYGMTWVNGTEPTLGEGAKVIYVSPTGAGTKDGTSWADAKAGIYTAMLAANDGDVLYLQTGTYTSHLAPVAATKSIGIYGGFTVADGTWATRDGFANPTIIDATSNPTVPFIRPESGVAQIVDGIACTNFTGGGVMLANGGTATVKNCTFTNCSSSGYGSNYIVRTTATNCTFTNCISASASGSIVGATATNCTFTNCSSMAPSTSSGDSGIVGTTATNCTFTNCISASGSSHIVGITATNCTFTNCTITSSTSGYNSGIVGTTATNCTLTRCYAARLMSKTSGYKVTNSVIWNSTITSMAFGAGTNNAATAYIDANTLVLGTDNTLANFVSIGTVETIGYSASLNSTPFADFGDFRPAAGSVLIGAGVAVSGVTTDIEGATRLDPPTIGAYEYVEETP